MDGQSIALDADEGTLMRRTEGAGPLSESEEMRKSAPQDIYIIKDDVSLT